MVRQRNWLQNLTRRISGHQGALDKKTVQDALNYIEAYWERLTFEQKKDVGTVIGLPHPYILPANDPKALFTLKEQYYWDSYFNSIGLAGTKHQAVVEGMLENLLHLFERFHFVPNASRMHHMSHSQPPILTSFIRLVYDSGGKDTAWLKRKMNVAEREYSTVWTSTQHPFWHDVFHGLSRYYDINVLHDLAEAESGWDMTPRFERKCLDYLPIDLNCLLYKYEMDFAWAARQCNNDADEKKWVKRAQKRQHNINKFMWHKRRGFFFDYNYKKREKGRSWSLAGFFPMWVGMASEDQAARMVKHLDKFEYAGGLVVTTKPLIDMSIFGSMKTQWAYPNGWAPLNWVVVEALKKYGYEEHAERIAKKWLHGNLLWYERHGEFLEKYNVVNPTRHPVEGLYPGQAGFGWTNSIFIALSNEYVLKSSDVETEA